MANLIVEIVTGATYRHVTGFSINAGPAMGCGCREWDDEAEGIDGCPSVILTGDRCFDSEDYGPVCVPCGRILINMMAG